ncbi:DUF2993 domain-containing protein [Agromyces neolithicus]|uniref:DUF2993 domain-containing protein n=1 Tax=Agromyces neolithicus TaxID=269420 RepID=A0ABP4YBV5_9MICO
MTDDAAGATPREHRSRAGRVWIIVAAIVVAVAVLLVITDVVVRGIAEQRVAEQIEAELPPGVEGEVDVSIGGFSVLAQYLAGSIDRVQLSAPELSVQGVPISVDVVATDLPPALDAPVGHITARLDADEAAINQLIEIPEVQGEVVLGDGIVGYSDTTRFLGIPIDYTVTARPIAAADRVLLEPVGVEVGAGGGAIDVSGLVDRITGGDPIPVCVAEHLPAGVEVAQIAVEPGTAAVTLEANGISLDEQSLATTGTCS